MGAIGPAVVNQEIRAMHFSWKFGDGWLCQPLISSEAFDKLHMNRCECQDCTGPFENIFITFIFLYDGSGSTTLTGVVALQKCVSALLSQFFVPFGATLSGGEYQPYKCVEWYEVRCYREQHQRYSDISIVDIFNTLSIDIELEYAV